MRILTSIALSALLAALSLAVAAAAPEKGAAKGTGAVPDTKLGLAPGSVFDTLTPDPVVPEASEPGAKKAPSRWNAVAPPMIPHGVADLLPITRESNTCVDCHLIDKQEKGDPVPIPASHRAAAKAGESAPLAGARWICLSCHEPLTSAKPLPASTRRADPAKR